MTSLIEQALQLAESIKNAAAEKANKNSTASKARRLERAERAEAKAIIAKAKAEARAIAKGPTSPELEEFDASDFASCCTNARHGKAPASAKDEWAQYYSIARDAGCCTARGWNKTVVGGLMDVFAMPERRAQTIAVRLKKGVMAQNVGFLDVNGALTESGAKALAEYSRTRDTLVLEAYKAAAESAQPVV